MFFAADYPTIPSFWTMILCHSATASLSFEAKYCPHLQEPELSTFLDISAITDETARLPREVRIRFSSNTESYSEVKTLKGSC